MITFKKKIEVKSYAYAYLLGADALSKGLSMGASPYDRGSQPDEDWVDGYLDALFVRKL